MTMNWQSPRLKTSHSYQTALPLTCPAPSVKKNKTRIHPCHRVYTPNPDGYTFRAVTLGGKVAVKKLSLLLVFLIASCSPGAVDTEAERWLEFTENITIFRDDWGIPHIYGKSDADAVFGMIYAQAEDDFNRIEVNYLNAMGRLAEAEGESALYRDLRMKLFIQPDNMKALYAESPEYLRKLMNAWADGLNYFLSTHPEVTPRVLTRFEPWMALSFTEGSIGGDIERISLERLENFYGERMSDDLAIEAVNPVAEPGGSNGFAIAPQNSASGNAMLLINPHTSFYFRSELHMVSEEGLNAYGAVTWGQFFVYQGFNARNGWMHTSSGADFMDEFLEAIIEREDGFYYQYGDETRKLETSEIVLPYKSADGMKEKRVTVYKSHRGPIVREVDGKWVSVSLMQEPVKALTQSYGRTKTTGYDSYKENMQLHTNSSNNTVFADADGNIAYFHGNFIPRRDPSFDWTKPVDGSNPLTEWKGLHSVDETVGALNPPNGWVQNTNNWPYSVAGDNSPRREDFPVYMSQYGENYRGINAVRVLSGKTDFTLDSLIEAAYDPYLAAFAYMLPPLISDYDKLGEGDAQRAELAEQIEILRAWDYNSSVSSVATTLAVFWGREMLEHINIQVSDEARAEYEGTPAEIKLGALKLASTKLDEDFGTWKTSWGDINRFQRLSGDIVQPFDDTGPSTAVGFTSSRWGSLAAFGQRTFNGTKKIYGTRGNSFVAVVEFGDRVRAKAITAGGLSSDPGNPHFADQISRYATGDLRDVYYYREDVERNATKTYHPGD